MKNVDQIAVPENLIEDFLEWFDVKIEQGILNNTPNPKKKSEPKKIENESGPAKEICNKFIPGNEYASRLIEIVEQEYPDLVISLPKFTLLIDYISQSVKRIYC